MCGENYMTRTNFRLLATEEQLKKDVEWFQHATLVTLPELYEEVQGWRRRFPQYNYDKKWGCIIDSKEFIE